MGRQRDSPPEQQHEQPHHSAGPHKAQLLANDGKNKIVLGLWHEQMLLAAVAQAQPGSPAGADGIQALDGLVAVAQRVSKRVQPGVEPVGGVGHKVGHDDHCRPDGGHPAHACQHEPLEPGAAHKHQHGSNAQDQQGARKVRLQQHQRRHHPQHQRKGKHAHGEAFHLVVVEGNDMAEHQHHREFGNFAGLQRAQPGQHQPALAAVVLRHKEHGHQQNEGESQQRPGQLMENMIIHPAGQPQAHQPQRRV